MKIINQIRDLNLSDWVFFILILIPLVGLTRLLIIANPNRVEKTGFDKCLENISSQITILTSTQSRDAYDNCKELYK